MMRIIILALALIGAVLTVPVKEESFQQFTKGNREFSALLYKELIKEQKGNLFVSPFAIETILSLVNEGAKGQTSKELVDGLHLPESTEEIQEVFETLLPKLLANSSSFKLQSANKIYVEVNDELDDDFVAVATKIYDSEVEHLDFSSAQASEVVNSWVQQHTNRKITDTISADEFDKETSILLLNTLYFTGKWANMFDRYDTKLKFYKTQDKSEDIYAILHRGATFNYWENKDLDAKFLELPLKETNASMVVVLPNEIDGLSGLEKNIEKVLEPQPFVQEIVLPKCTTESKLKLASTLENLGIKKVFESDADLSGISSTNSHIHVTNVIQKTYLRFTETAIQADEGTDPEAVAKETSRSEPLNSLKDEEKVNFKIDHPFLYYIQQNGVILFSGRCVEPDMN